MPASLLTNGVWDEITRLARKAGSARVAVAYFGQGASRLLPLKAGDVLVINMSQGAVKSGQTCPEEVIKLLRKGVEVHSCSNLHAKVFVFGRRAIVGSSNVSRNSAQSLVEAAVETTDPETVRSCREFVDSLRGEHVDLDFARSLEKFYRPPRFAGAAESKAPRHYSFWAVPLTKGSWEPEDQVAYDRGEPVAVRMLEDQERFQLESFSWDGAWSRRPLAVGELLMSVTREAPRRIMLSPVARVIHIRHYKPAGEPRMIVYLSMPRLRRKNLRDLVEKLGTTGQLILSLKRSPRLIKKPQMVHELLQLWPSLQEVE